MILRQMNLNETQDPLQTRYIVSLMIIEINEANTILKYIFI